MLLTKLKCLLHLSRYSTLRSNFSWTPNQKITLINMLVDSLQCTDNKHTVWTKVIGGTYDYKVTHNEKRPLNGHSPYEKSIHQRSISTNIKIILRSLSFCLQRSIQIIISTNSKSILLKTFKLFLNYHIKLVKETTVSH